MLPPEFSGVSLTCSNLNNIVHYTIARLAPPARASSNTTWHPLRLAIPCQEKLVRDKADYKNHAPVWQAVNNSRLRSDSSAEYYIPIRDKLNISPHTPTIFSRKQHQDLNSGTLAHS